jgi:EmrB/QacA subfamily drug resistance transporter
MDNFDYIGFITSVVGMVSILYVLGEGSTIDWGDVKNPFLITLGCFCLVMFVINELTHANPLIDLKILKIFNFSLSQVVSVILTFSLMGGMYVVPVFLQNLRGFTAMETGLVLLPSAIATGIFMPIAGKLYDKFGLKSVVIPGLILLAIPSYFLSFLNLNTSKDMIMILLTMRGIGLGLSMMPINTAGMNVVPKHLAGNASALSNTIRQVGSAIAVTIMTTIINGKLNYNYGKMSEQITLFNPTAMEMLSKLRGLLMKNGISNINASGGALYQMYGYVFREAYILAMGYALAITSFITILAVLGVMLMRDKKDVNNKKDTIEGEENLHAAVFE